MGLEPGGSLIADQSTIRTNLIDRAIDPLQGCGSDKCHSPTISHQSIGGADLVRCFPPLVTNFESSPPNLQLGLKGHKRLRD